MFPGESFTLRSDPYAVARFGPEATNFACSFPTLWSSSSADSVAASFTLFFPFGKTGLTQLVVARPSSSSQRAVFFPPTPKVFPPPGRGMRHLFQKGGYLFFPFLSDSAFFQRTGGAFPPFRLSAGKNVFFPRRGFFFEEPFRPVGSAFSLEKRAGHLPRSASTFPPDSFSFRCTAFPFFSPSCTPLRPGFFSKRTGSLPQLICASRVDIERGLFFFLHTSTVFLFCRVPPFPLPLLDEPVFSPSKKGTTRGV